VSYVKLAFRAWQMFYRSMNPRSSINQQPSYQQFSSSATYTAFVKFGSWCEENQIQEFVSLVTWLLKQNVKLDSWCDLNRYQNYLQDLVDNESSEQAVSRSLATLCRWAQDTNQNWNQFFQLVNTNVAVGWIMQGRISPWLLYNCNSAVEFLQRCNPEQLALIQDRAPITKWKVRFLRNREEADSIKQTLEEAGV
jgi:hypothetical protein